MRSNVILSLAAALAAAGPLQAQDNGSDATTWELGGLRSAFCVQLLLDPASEMLQSLPTGWRAVPASAATNLHVSLRSVVEGQGEFAGWSPSRLCFATVDTIRTKEFSLTDRSGRRPQLFGFWTVLAAGPAGSPRDVALDLFTNSDRLIRSARLAGQEMHEARVTVGKVPAEDENGVPSSDDRFQVKLGGTVVTWDGRLAGDSVAVTEPVENTWSVTGMRGGVVGGSLTLSPTHSQPMAGSLKIDGKNDLARALRASPTRFAGPAFRGGPGKVTFAR
ncbi:MAG TPA: hypothetical protein VJQ46_09945 [Gemmatimonadales bacterium]|nr:hypothetical protein [Gemmatimonadales bacterium]